MSLLPGWRRERPARDRDLSPWAEQGTDDPVAPLRPRETEPTTEDAIPTEEVDEP